MCSGGKMGKILLLIICMLPVQLMAIENKGKGTRSIAKLMFLINSADESLHIEGCRKGDSNDCLVVALKYQINAKDELALDYLNYACDDFYDGIGCLYLAYHHQNNNDYEQKLKYFDKACQLKVGRACFELVFVKVEKICGDLVSCTYYDFSEDPKHQKELRRLVRKACHLGYERACRLLR